MLTAATWLLSMLVVPGGALWALTPMGITLAESRLPEGQDGFWQLFSSAPLLILAGLAGLHLRRLTGTGGLLRWLAFLIPAAGFLLVAAGNIGQFWLGVDDVFILAAPGYHAFRAGLVVAAAGAVVLGASALGGRTLPSWTVPPFLAAALGGLAAFAVDLGPTGAMLWALFGLGWVWLGVVVFARDVLGVILGRRGSRGKPARETAGETG